MRRDPSRADRLRAVHGTVVVQFDGLSACPAEPPPADWSSASRWRRRSRAWGRVGQAPLRAQTPRRLACSVAPRSTPCRGSFAPASCPGSRLAAVSRSCRPSSRLPLRIRASPRPSRGIGSRGIESEWRARTPVARARALNSARWAKPRTVCVRARPGSSLTASLASRRASSTLARTRATSRPGARGRARPADSTFTASNRLARASSSSKLACCAYESAIQAAAESGSAVTASLPSVIASALSPWTTAMIDSTAFLRPSPSGRCVERFPGVAHPADGEQQHRPIRLEGELRHARASRVQRQQARLDVALPECLDQATRFFAGRGRGNLTDDSR